MNLIQDMEETVRNNHQTEDQNIHPTTLLTERLEQLGYECLSDKCERFTTLRLVPIEIKRKEQLPSPPSE